MTYVSRSYLGATITYAARSNQEIQIRIAVASCHWQVSLKPIWRDKNISVESE